MIDIYIISKKTSRTSIIQIILKLLQNSILYSKFNHSQKQLSVFLINSYGKKNIGKQFQISNIFLFQILLSLS